MTLNKEPIKAYRGISRRTINLINAANGAIEFLDKEIREYAARDTDSVKQSEMLLLRSGLQNLVDHFTESPTVGEMNNQNLREYINKHFVPGIHGLHMLVNAEEINEKENNLFSYLNTTVLKNLTTNFKNIETLLPFVNNVLKPPIHIEQIEKALQSIEKKMEKASKLGNEKKPGFMPPDGNDNSNN